MTARSQPALSALDTRRWKAVTVVARDVTAESLPGVLAFCREQTAGFLIARCATGDLAAAQAMERAGFQLMDTLVYFSRDLTRGLPERSNSVAIRDLAAGEAAAVRQLAARSFAGYAGHYHADARLDRRQCDEVYADWAERCCSKEAADTVLVAADGHAIAGFVGIRLSTLEAEVALFAVAPEAQGRGIGRALLAGALHWAAAKHAARVAISTQITNVRSQRLWTGLGFEPSRSFYTFHKWF